MVRGYWMQVVLTLCLGAGVLTVAAPAWADDAVVVVVEASGEEVDAAAVRGALAERLERSVLSMFDEGTAGAAGVLSIALHAGRGEARVQYRTSEATLLWTAAAFPSDADPAGLWVVDHAVAVVRAADLQRGPTRLTSCLEVLDPWRHQARTFGDPDYRLPPEVLDPFAPQGRASMAYRIPSEVIDPWAPRSTSGRSAPPSDGEPGESGSSLAPPRPER